MTEYIFLYFSTDFWYDEANTRRLTGGMEAAYEIQLYRLRQYGSTIAGIRALVTKGFRGAVMDCVISANEVNKELGK